jgi:hypothetical protein
MVGSIPCHGHQKIGSMSVKKVKIIDYYSKDLILEIVGLDQARKCFIVCSSSQIGQYHFYRDFARFANYEYLEIVDKDFISFKNGSEILFMQNNRQSLNRMQGIQLDSEYMDEFCGKPIFDALSIMLTQ